jgi:putative sugar O-methyltransferase
MTCDLNQIDAMFAELKNAPQILQPSNTWACLNRTNLAQLKLQGLENIRNTVACNYFTFTGDQTQLRFLKSNVSKFAYLLNKLRTKIALQNPFVRRYLKNKELPDDFLEKHTYYTQMLYDYVKKIDHLHLIHKVCDSKLGNPPPIYRWGKLLTADLYNSMIEYYSIMNEIPKNELHEVIEIGAGYGRNASVFLQLHENLRYIICDIPPALYVSQSYLTQRFPDKKIFYFRPFQSYQYIRKEWEGSHICFILPHQLPLLPDKKTDLVINISSFHEMRTDQINYYFKQIDRLTNGHFYLKQWQTSILPEDNLTIHEDDYPELPQWKRRYSRICEVQTKFFERLYEI